MAQLSGILGHRFGILVFYLKQHHGINLHRAINPQSAHIRQITSRRHEITKALVIDQYLNIKYIQIGPMFCIVINQYF